MIYVIEECLGVLTFLGLFMGSPSTLNPELSSSFLAMLEESSSALLAEELSLILLLDAAWTSSVSDMTHNHFGFQQQEKWGEIILTQPHLYMNSSKTAHCFFKGRRRALFLCSRGCRALLANLYVSGGVFFLQFGQRPPAHTPLLAEL